MDELWKYGLLGGGLPATVNPNIWSQGVLARQQPRKQLEGYEAAQMAGMVPGLGLVGMLGDVQQYIEKPETRGILNYGLTALGAVPFLGAMAKMAGNIPQGVRQSQAGAIGYHGSPHQFDKFDMSKVGTGEGAQAYGHGLYFAENPKVASEYRAKLARGEIRSGDQVLKGMDASPEGEVVARLTHARQGFASLNTNGGQHEINRAAIDYVRGSLDDGIEAAKNSGDFNTFKRLTDQKVALGRMENRGVEFLDAGALYKVDIPDEQVGKMLDWDKPLKQQPGIKSLLESNGLGHWLSAPAATGRDLIAVLQTKMGDAQASQFLRKLGIPGIKYLDQGSRSAGEGTRNFVVFDDSLPKILERR